jgi:hypothetical protein
MTNQEFSNEIKVNKNELLNDLSIIVNYSESYCSKNFEVEYHVNMDRLIIHYCNTDTIPINKRKRIYNIMKRRDVNRIYLAKEGIFFDFFNINNLGKLRPKNTILLYSKMFTEEKYSKIDKIQENWFLVQKHPNDIEYIITK